MRNDGTPGAAQLTTGLIIGDETKIDSGETDKFATNDTFQEVRVDKAIIEQYGNRPLQLMFKSPATVSHRGGGSGAMSYAPQTFLQSVWIAKDGSIGAMAMDDVTAAFEYSIVVRDLPHDEKIEG